MNHFQKRNVLLLPCWLLILTICTWIRAHSISMSAIISPNRGRISFFTVKHTRQILSSSRVFMGTGKSIFLVFIPFDTQQTQFLAALVPNENTLRAFPTSCFSLVLEHYTAPIHIHNQLHKNCVTNKQ